MKNFLILLVFVALVAGCVQETTTTTVTTTTLEMTTTTIAETTTTTTAVIAEQSIEILDAESGRIKISNIGSVQFIMTSDIELFINDESVDPEWLHTIIYPGSETFARATCNDGDTIKVVAPGNEATDTCVATEE